MHLQEVSYHVTKDWTRYELSPCFMASPPNSIGCNGKMVLKIKNKKTCLITFVRLCLKIFCAKFGEYWKKIVACEIFLYLLDKIHYRGWISYVDLTSCHVSALRPTWYQQTQE